MPQKGKPQRPKYGPGTYPYGDDSVEVRKPDGLLDQILKSSFFADTLTRLFGQPDYIGNIDYANPQGVYWGGSGKPVIGVQSDGPAANIMDVINPSGIDRRTLKQDAVLTHEMAHHKGQTDSETRRGDGVESQFSYATRRLPPGSKQEVLGAGSAEHFAYAMANAVDVLREAATLGKTPNRAGQNAAGRLVDEAEKNVAGSKIAINTLLDHPLYANHPMQAYRRLVSKSDKLTWEK